MRYSIVLIGFTLLILIGCKKDSTFKSEYEVDQVQYVHESDQLCFNESVNFENYIVYGDSTSDSINWYAKNKITGIFEYYATGNPIEIPTQRIGQAYRLVEYYGSDSIETYFSFWSCYGYIYIPHGFSPNNDGLNDIWLPLSFDPTNGLDSYLARVLTTDGITLFETGNDQVGWDGLWNGILMPSGSYLYYIEQNFIDGSDAVYTGELSIVR